MRFLFLLKSLNEKNSTKSVLYAILGGIPLAALTMTWIEAQYLYVLIAIYAIIQMLIDIFTKNGYEIAGEADSCEEGVKAYKELKPDLVMMDIIMPDTSGIEAIKDIISFDSNARIIVCSALGHQANVLDALNAGAKHFIEKPFQPPKIIEAAKKVLGE